MEFYLRLLRKDIIKLACELGIEDCILTAKDNYQLWKNDNTVNLIPKKYRSLVYCTAINHGSGTDWIFAFEQYKVEDNLNNKNDLAFGMSCVRDPNYINTYLSAQLNEKYTRVQDGLTGIRYALSNMFSTMLTWNFIKNNWDELFKK